MTPANVYPIAPMSPLFRAMTWAVLLLPVVFLAIATFGVQALAIAGVAMVALYVWVWLRFRPNRFVVHPREFEVRWPLKTRRLARTDIVRVQRIDADALRAQTGWVARVGVGGLWGAFGWLWTERKGIVQMYITRSDGLVWIELKNARPWLITPADPDAFVQALSPA